MSGRNLVAVFAGEAQLLAAVGALRREGYPIADVYTPYAVHGLERAVGLPRSNLGRVCALAALVGSLSFLVFQDWVMAVSWPLNVGGKPFSTLPAWIPVVFEAGVLAAGLATVLALFIAGRLYPGKPARLPHPRVTDDRFAVVVELPDAGLDPHRFRRLCAEHGAEAVEEIPAPSPSPGALRRPLLAEGSR